MGTEPAIPYPAQWERHDTLPGGERIFIRPFRPGDLAHYPDFLADVTAEDLRLRFFAPIRTLSDAVLRRLGNVDYRNAMVFLAFAEDTDRLLGVVRLHRDPAGDGGEYAVLVRSSLKGRGLGWLLMKRMIGYARASGLQHIHGQVLSENTTMLSMCTELGFDVADDPHEKGVKIVTLALRPGGTRPPAPR